MSNIKNRLSDFEYTEGVHYDDFSDIDVVEPTVVKSVAQQRKDTPIYSGVLKYFPLALAEVARCSKAGNDQHNPNMPLHWDRSKSKDELDALTRHLIDHSVNPVDTDGVLHLAKCAWRSLAALEKHIENENKKIDE